MEALFISVLFTPTAFSVNNSEVAAEWRGGSRACRAATPCLCFRASLQCEGDARFDSEVHEIGSRPARRTHTNSTHTHVITHPIKCLHPPRCHILCFFNTACREVTLAGLLLKASASSSQISRPVCQCVFWVCVCVFFYCARMQTKHPHGNMPPHVKRNAVQPALDVFLF